MGMGAWGWEHDYTVGQRSVVFVLFVICCYLFHSHCMLLWDVFGIVSELFFCCMI